MTRKLGAKVTHHCWCGKTGSCRKHSARCRKHNIDYYASGLCKACEGEEAAAARKAHQEKQDQKKDLPRNIGNQDIVFVGLIIGSEGKEGRKAETRIMWSDLEAVTARLKILAKAV